MRFAWRVLARRPGFTAAAGLCLALGIGANTAAFSLLNAVFLRPPPVADPRALVAVYGTEDTGAGPSGFHRLSYPNFLDYRRQCGTFQAMAADQGLTLTLTGSGRSERLTGRLVSEDFFEVLGVRPALGRTLATGDGAEEGFGAVLSYGFWRRRFGGDPGAIGRVLTLNGVSFTIVGVAAEGFNGLFLNRAPEVFLPLAAYELVSPFARFLEDRGVAMFQAVGRLAPGHTLAEAAAEMDALAVHLRQEHPDDNEGQGVTLLPFTLSTTAPARRPVLLAAGRLLLAAMALLLLIACVTVANLLLALAESRRRELAVRVSLGAAGGRLARQLWVESSLLCLASGALSLPLALLAAAALWRRFHPAHFDDGAVAPGLDVRVLGFTFAAVLATALLCGLVPLARARGAALARALREGAAPSSGRRRGGSWSLRSLLVVVQLAVSTAALIGAGLFLRSLLAARRLDPGFDSAHLLETSFDLGGGAYGEEAAREFRRRVVERVRSLPGVAAASLAESGLLSGAVMRWKLGVEGRSAGGEGEPLIHSNRVGADYFSTTGIPLLRGRGFTAEDRPDGVPVAVVNEVLARQLWPGEDAIGQRFNLGGDPPWIEVVGVAKTASYEGVGEEPMPYLYLPLEQRPVGAVTLVVRSGGDPARLLPTVERAVQALDPDLPLFAAATAPQLEAEALRGARTAAALSSLFAALALVLAAVGTYGVMAYLTQQRRPEIGIRLALGARKRQVLGPLLGHGSVLVGVGAVLGVVVALALTRAAAGLLYGIAPDDPLTFAVVASLLVAVALAACYLGTRRALGADPLAALRQP